MANNNKYIRNLTKLETEIGVAKKNETMKTSDVGNMEFEVCKLEDVMYVPDLNMNLLSVSAITNKDGVVTFTKDKVIIESNNQEIIAESKTGSGLYEVNLQNGRKIKSCLTKNTVDEAKMWHQRLGHMGKSNMKKLLKISEGMSLTESDIESMTETCDVCMKSKQTGNSFENSRTRANRLLEIIHTDVCGPIEPTT